MKSKLIIFLLALTLPHVCIAAPVPFSSPEHRTAATVPDGWDQVQGVTQQSVLKIARLGTGSQKARIAVMLHDLPAGRFAPGYDIWSMSDDDIRKAAGSNSMAGEAVTVLNAGRGAVDGLHMVWSKTRRNAPDGSTLWEFAYEGVRGAEYLTIRLTSVGDQDWFTANQAVFAEFIRTFRVSAASSGSYQPPAKPSIAPASYSFTAQTSSDAPRPTIKITKSGDSFWTALGKSAGEQFLKVLGAVILISVVGALWSKFKSK